MKIIIILLIIICSQSSFASGCTAEVALFDIALDKQEYAVANSDIVFSGKLLVRTITTQEIFDTKLIIKNAEYIFQPTKILKGDIGDRNDKIVLEYEAFGCSCDGKYDFGKEYRVYGIWTNKEQNKIRTRICTIEGAM